MSYCFLVNDLQKRIQEGLEVQLLDGIEIINFKVEKRLEDEI